MREIPQSDCEWGKSDTEDSFKRGLYDFGLISVNVAITNAYVHAFKGFLCQGIEYRLFDGKYRAVAEPKGGV